MSTPYGNDPQQQWGQQPHGQQQWGQQPQYPQSGPLPQQPQSGPQPQQYPGYDQQQQWQQPAQPAQPQYEQQWQQPQQQPAQQYPGYEQPAGYQGGYGQYPSFEAEDGGGKKSKAWLWITLTVVVLAAGAVAVLGFVAPGFFNTKTLDGGGVEQGVVQIHGQGGTKVENVSCPDDIKVEKDATGECTATINGEKKTIKITVVDAESDPPKYEVGQPQ